MVSSKAHHVVYRYHCRLATRGHNVTMYSMAKSTLGGMGEGVKTVESHISEDQAPDGKGIVEKLFWYGEMDPWIFEPPYFIGFTYLKKLQNDDNFLEIKNTAFDVTICDEMFVSAQAAIAQYQQETFGTKIAVFSTTDLFGLFSQYRGLSRNPVTYPSYYSKGYGMYDYNPQNFKGRFISFAETILEWYFTGVRANVHVENSGELLGVTSNFQKIYKDSWVTFLDYPSRYGYATPRSHDLVYVGEHCQPANKMPEDLRSFVEDPKSKGTIYIAFGSIVDWNAASPEVLSTFVEVLNKLTEYRVIWSYTGPELTLKPHIRLMLWAPQNDILAHDKTIIFFTHGGLKSLKEGICSNTAMLFLPFFADQPKNALYAVNMGIAEAIYKRKLPWFNSRSDLKTWSELLWEGNDLEIEFELHHDSNMTVVEIESKMSRVLENPSYKHQISKLNAHFTDNVMDSLDLGAFWTEWIVRVTPRHREFYRIRGAMQPWMLYLQFDVLFLVVGMIFVSID